MASEEARAFEEALVALGGLINQRKRADGSNWGDAFALMNEYVRVLGLEEAVANQSLIHVAGTKGKGSTCAFAESILRASGHTTGLFTSPHLVDVRERFRVNGEMVPIPIFLEHFWWCYNTCKEACSRDPSIPMPAYFRFLTLLALRLFSQLKVDVVLLEVGIGGRYDATNIVKHPAVCGVSTLGFDHMELLGDTLGLIAGEKAGIFKRGVPAVTSPQEEEALLVLKQKAAELQIPLAVLVPGEGVPEGARLGLAGKHQRVNAALAVALSAEWAQRTGRHKEAEAVREAVAQGTLPQAYLDGLRDASWPGRCQIIRDVPFPADLVGGATNGGGDGALAAAEAGAGGERGAGEDGVPGVSFYLDGAHTPESMEVCAEWFCDELQSLPGRGRGKGTGRDTAAELHRTPLKNGSEASAEAAPGAASEPSSGADVPREGNGSFSSPFSAGGAGEGERRGAEGESAVEGGASPGVPRKVLLFNCMPERDPELLFSRLLATLSQRGVRMDSAIFVPPLSSYSSLVTPLGQAAAAPLPDLSWQQGLKETWDRLHRERVTGSLPGAPEGGPAGAAPAGGTTAGGTPRGGTPAGATPPPSAGGAPAVSGGVPEGAVASSLPAAMSLLWPQGPGARRDVKVLVTGSLHLVGDVLRILQRHL